jgi:phosphoglycerate kinase
METLDLTNQRVLIREDFNVPMHQGKITHTARIDAAVPTLRAALAKGAKVIVLSHMGRPTEGTFDAALSLQPVADYLSTVLGKKVPLFQLDEPMPTLASGDIALLENVRFLKGEERNDPALAQRLAQLGDIFVMDAFAVAHRAQASTVGVAQCAPIACAGPLLCQELDAISAIVKSPQHPVMAIVGGSKVSTKLALLHNLLNSVDVLALGGGIANTFLAALGHPIGDSLYESTMIDTALDLWNKAQDQQKIIWLATDVVVAPDISATQGIIKPLAKVVPGDKIFDIGPDSQASLTKLIQSSKTLLWNGPVGVFENPAFAQGTRSITTAIKTANTYSVAGGGDTLAAIEQFNATNALSYLSTGGGAFLEALEGKTLPAVAILQQPHTTQ